jgi:hypothetical protein
MSRLVSGTLLSAFIGLSCSRASTPNDAYNSDRLTTRIECAKSQFTHETGSAAITGEAADEIPPSVRKLIFLELDRYPTRLLQRMALFEIIVCESLRADGEPRVMTFNLVSGTLYVDCRILEYPRVFAQRVLHHEVFHLIDYRDDGNVYADEEWFRLNPRNFEYLKSVSKATAKYGDLTALNVSQPGLLSGYSAVSLEEDKAELFSFMVVDPRMVERQCAQDTVVSAKAARIRAILNSFGPGTARDLLGTD